jgi:adenylosuccinate lyase
MYQLCPCLISINPIYYNSGMAFSYQTYLSPFTWRYGSDEMRHMWSESNKRCLWRLLWVVLAETQVEFGLVQPEQAAELRAHMRDVDVPRALEIEAELRHDLMAELKVFAEQTPLGGKILHLGATSTDIEDNADVLRVRQSLDLILVCLQTLLGTFAEKIEAWVDTPLIAFTHLQPAEPSTLGYRLAQYAQDLLLDWQVLTDIRAGLRGKGFKGAVGTGAAYAELLGADQLERFERRLSERLELPFFPIATQVYPRKQDYQVVSALAGLGGSLYKFAFDLRILQSPPVGELSEPFGKKQVGSSAMPFKRNPIDAEKIDSLGRALAQMPRLAWDNAAHSLLERTLDDSANRRTLLPEAFLTTDELLHTAGHILSGLQVNRPALKRNLDIYGPFAAIERVLMALGKAGADRQEMHERLRVHSLAAWSALQAGQSNPLIGSISQDTEMQRYLPEAGLRALMDASRYLGDAPSRARQLAAEIHSKLKI